jgi:hypothetical protein
MALPPDGEPFPLDRAISPQTPIASVVRPIEALLRRNGFEWDELRKILALRAEFFEIDTRFGELGPRLSASRTPFSGCV